MLKLEEHVVTFQCYFVHINNRALYNPITGASNVVVEYLKNKLGTPLFFSYFLRVYTPWNIWYKYGEIVVTLSLYPPATLTHRMDLSFSTSSYISTSTRKDINITAAGTTEWICTYTISIPGQSVTTESCNTSITTCK